MYVYFGHEGTNCSVLTKPPRTSPLTAHTLMMPSHTAESSSVVAIAVRVSVGCLVGLIATVLVVCAMYLERRGKHMVVNVVRC